MLPFKLVAIIDVNMAVIRIKKPRGPGEKDQPLEGEPKLKRIRIKTKVTDEDIKPKPKLKINLKKKKESADGKEKKNSLKLKLNLKKMKNQLRRYTRRQSYVSNLLEFLGKRTTQKPLILKMTLS